VLWLEVFWGVVLKCVLQGKLRFIGKCYLEMTGLIDRGSAVDANKLCYAGWRASCCSPMGLNSFEPRSLHCPARGISVYTELGRS
jgi:hypothetical protein